MGIRYYKPKTGINILFHVIDLTGEQNEIEKSINSNLMSGSFVISGRAVVKLTNVGDESFSAKIMKEKASKIVRES